MASETLGSTNLQVKRNDRWRAVGEVVLLELLSVPFIVVGLSNPDPTSAMARVTPVVGIFATLALTWFFVRRRGQHWSDYGLQRPASWLRTLGLGLLATVGCLVIMILLNGILASFTEAEPDLGRFQDMKDNPLMLGVGLVSAWFIAAIPEEMINRGFILTRLSKAFGGSHTAWILCSFFSSMVFGLGHYYQGPIGVLMTGLVGFLFCLVFLGVKRNLWVCIIAHGLIDTLGFTLIYLGAQG